jgi:hypothetical protein
MQAVKGVLEILAKLVVVLLSVASKMEAPLCHRDQVG